MNSRKNIYGLPILLSALLLTACTSETEDAGNVVAFVTGMEQTPTRSTSRDNMWNVNDEVAITDGTTVKKYVASESGLAVPLVKAASEASPFYWSIGKGNMTFSAWRPYTPTNESLAVTVAADQRATSSDAIADEGTLTDAVFNTYDLLYASPKEAASGITVPLQFYHQMAHIIVYVIGVATDGHVDPETQQMTNVQEIEEVTRVILGSDNMSLTGTLTKRGVTGPTATESDKAVWSVGTGNSSITMRDADTQTGLGVNNLKKRRVFECILPPQSGGTDPIYEDDGKGGKRIKDNGHGTVLLTFYTSSRTENPYKYEAAFDYKAGYQYVYYIGLTRAGLYVGYTVEDWASVTSTGARTIFNYMDHPGVTITDWTAPSSTTKSNLGKF